MGGVSDELRRVGAGLKLVALGLAAMAGSAILGAVVAAVLGEPSLDPNAVVFGLNRDHPAAMALVVGLGVLATVLGIAGKAYCLAVPEGSGGRPFIVMSLGCAVIGLTLSVLGRNGEPPEAGAAMSSAGSVFTVGGFVFFVRFLGRLAAFLGSVRLLLAVRRVQLVATALMIVLLLAMVGVSARVVLAVVPLAMVGLILGLGLFLLYTLLVLDIRKVTEAAADYAAGLDEG